MTRSWYSELLSACGNPSLCPFTHFDDRCLAILLLAGGKWLIMSGGDSLALPLPTIAKKKKMSPSRFLCFTFANGADLHLAVRPGDDDVVGVAAGHAAEGDAHRQGAPRPVQGGSDEDVDGGDDAGVRLDGGRLEQVSPDLGAGAVGVRRGQEPDDQHLEGLPC